MRASALLTAVLLIAAGSARADASAEASCPKPEQPAPARLALPQGKPAEGKPKEQKLDASCWLTPEEAFRPEGAAAFIWVDVRPAARARAHPLSGALQIPLGDLAGKGFLRNEPVVLVGSGLDGTELGKRCVALRAAGFSRLRLLEGGVPAWHAAGRFVGGASFAGDEVAPAELVAASVGEPLRLVAVGLEPESIARLPQAPVKSLPLAAPGELQPQLAALAKAGGSGAVAAPLIVIAPDGERTRALKSRAGAQPGGRSLLWLQGGWAAYRNYLEQHQQITSNSGRPLRRPCGA